MTPTKDFGALVNNEAARLKSLGKDPNQIADILCQQDSAGCNYGIGIMLEGDGKPMKTSATLLKFIEAEAEASDAGTYRNSSKIMDSVTEAVLRWQRIPEEHWQRFKLALPSDAGTGAVQTALMTALSLYPELHSVAVESQGWPAYRAIAQMARASFKEIPGDAAIDEQGTLPIYQAGPMNTSGRVYAQSVAEGRAAAAGRRKSPVILDRAYTGFEFARELAASSYDQILRKSYQSQIEPFIKEKVPFLLALSPTKSFCTFSLRPCGLLLIHVPDPARDTEISLALGLASRARGSSFEHVVTRAFAKALVNDLSGLESEHEGALKRLAEAETLWTRLSAGTPVAPLFTPNYAGLFRNPKVKADAPLAIYNEHVYPVFSDGRCRLNVTGIPQDEDLARKHIQLFADWIE